MRAIAEEIREIVAEEGSRILRAEKVAAAIRSHDQYRWVGIYDVTPDVVSIVAYSGPGAPAFRTFPVTQGLTSAAIQQKATVRVNDVSQDSRYLTAFGSTRAEIIVPVIRPTDGRVIGTIDVESEQANAFSDQDQRMLEECAGAASGLWVRHQPNQ
jgi:L-methionine (R)-S-oxide reductase